MTTEPASLAAYLPLEGAKSTNTQAGALPALPNPPSGQPLLPLGSKRPYNTSGLCSQLLMHMGQEHPDLPYQWPPAASGLLVGPGRRNSCLLALPSRACNPQRGTASVFLRGGAQRSSHRPEPFVPVPFPWGNGEGSQVAARFYWIPEKSLGCAEFLGGAASSAPRLLSINSPSVTFSTGALHVGLQASCSPSHFSTPSAVAHAVLLAQSSASQRGGAAMPPTLPQGKNAPPSPKSQQAL